MGIQNVLGVDYPYPDTGDKPWGVEHIDWATAVSNATNTLNAAVGSLPTDVTALQAAVAALQVDVTTLQTDKVETSSNSGTGEGLALPKVGTDLPFKSITAGPNIVLTASATELNINSVAGGTGDVVGPAGAVDENIAVFDGVTGKLIKDGGITIASILASVSPVNYVESSGSGLFSTTSSSFTNVTNLAVTITNLAGPIKIELSSDSSTNPSGYISLGGSNVGEVYASLRITRNGTNLKHYYFGTRVDALTTTVDAAISIPASSFCIFDPAPPGTYTYQVQVARETTSTTVNVGRVKLVAYEVK